MKKYEGLFVLNIPNREDGVKEVIDKVTEEIGAAGAKVLTVQKMDKRAFVRVANRRHNSGFYVNFIFEADPGALESMRHRFAMNPDIFRVLFTGASEQKQAVETV